MTKTIFKRGWHEDYRNERSGKERELIYHVYAMWYDSLPQTMDEESAKAAIRQEIEMINEINDPNTNTGSDLFFAAIELGNMPIEEFVEQWNWLNDNQPSDYADAKKQFKLNKF